MKEKTRNKGWTYFSSAAVWLDKSLSLDAIIVWHALMVFRNHKTGKCHPSIWTIGQVARIGRRRVHAATSELIAAGIVKKTTKLLGEGGRLTGKKCFYTVMAMDSWVTREKLLERSAANGAERTTSERSDSERSVVDQEQLATPEQLPTTEHKGKNTLQPGLEFTFPDGDPEKFSLLADWGIEASVASHVFDRMSALSWRPPEGGAFRDERNARNFVYRLSIKIEDDMQGNHRPSLKAPPASGSGEKVMAPVETGSQDDWREPDNDGPQDG